MISKLKVLLQILKYVVVNSLYGRLFLARVSFLVIRKLTRATESQCKHNQMFFSKMIEQREYNFPRFHLRFYTSIARYVKIDQT